MIVLLKLTIKVRKVGETDLTGNFLNAEVGLDEFLTGFFKT